MSDAPSIDPDAVFFLKRRYNLRLRLARGVIGAVPLADWVLLLLMFMVLHSWVILRPAVPLMLPSGPAVDGVGMHADVLTMTREGLIFFDDTRLTPGQLADQLIERARRNPDAVLLIQADRRVTHDDLMQVYHMAGAAGYQSVFLATQPLQPHQEEP